MDEVRFKQYDMSSQLASELAGIGHVIIGLRKDGCDELLDDAVSDLENKIKEFKNYIMSV